MALGVEGGDAFEFIGDGVVLARAVTAQGAVPRQGEADPGGVVAVVVGVHGQVQPGLGGGDSAGVGESLGVGEGDQGGARIVDDLEFGQSGGYAGASEDSIQGAGDLQFVAQGQGGDRYAEPAA